MVHHDTHNVAKLNLHAGLSKVSDEESDISHELLVEVSA